MRRARNKNLRRGRQQRNTRPQKPLTKPRNGSGRSERRRRDTWPHRFLGWIAAANKAVLAAIGAGLIGIITAAVTGLPHLIADAVNGSRPALTTAGGSSPNNSAPADPCQLQGVFVVPRPLHPARHLSTNQVSALVQDAADDASTSGTYTLQAQQNQTVVITAIHTIVVKRVPAQRATVVDIESFCLGAAPPTYSVSVNLDAANLTPQVQLENSSGAGETKLVHGLQAIVTNGSPILIDFEADTSKYDVTWKFRIDYTVNGKQEVAWIQNGSQPFHTIATRHDDTALQFTLNSDQTSWTWAPESLGDLKNSGG